MWGLGPHLGGRGRQFGSILGVWAGSGSQVHLGRRFGRLLDYFKSQDSYFLNPKTVPSWSQNDIKIDAKIIDFLLPLKIDFWRNSIGFWLGKWKQLGTQIGSKVDIGAIAEKSTKR